MTKRTHLKAGPGERPGKLTYEQVETLAREIADEAGGNDILAPLLLLVMEEVVKFCRDPLHVEMVAFKVRDAVFSRTTECHGARERHVCELREKFQKGGEGR